MFLKVWTLGLTFESSTLCPTKGSTYAYYIDYFQPISLDSTKFGHSIPQPLELDDHSVKRPLANAPLSLAGMEDDRLE